MRARTSLPVNAESSRSFTGGAVGAGIGTAHVLGARGGVQGDRAEAVDVHASVRLGVHVGGVKRRNSRAHLRGQAEGSWPLVAISKRAVESRVARAVLTDFLSPFSGQQVKYPRELSPATGEAIPAGARVHGPRRSRGWFYMKQHGF
jgi:hypothetical protein